MNKTGKAALMIFSIFGLMAIGKVLSPWNAAWIAWVTFAVIDMWNHRPGTGAA
jgi:hypothetical protein